ncbi:MAG: DedA family protein [Verrucomicrobiae bacterium]|nr:DedA family protein [Verrucomicrobiae bacterium]
MPRLSRQTLLLLAGLAPLFLAGCSDNLDPLGHLDRIVGLPLWQKVVAIAVSSLISEDLACIAAGILASKGVLTLEWAILASFLGIYLGDIPLYLMGRLGGLTLLRRVPFRWFLKEQQILLAEDLFRDHGGKLILSSRLLPGSRLPVYAAAGVLNYPFWKFAIYMFVAATLSSVILTWISMRLGEVVFEWLEVYESYFLPVALSVIAIVWIVVKALEILATKRSRLVFLARWRKFLGLARRRRLRS